MPLSERLFIAAGAYLYGALALIGVFALGLYVGDTSAAAAAVVAAGFAYAAQLFGALSYGGAGFAFSIASIVCGIGGLVMVAV